MVRPAYHKLWVNSDFQSPWGMTISTKRLWVDPRDLKLVSVTDALLPFSGGIKDRA